jgi:hypothetical protein
VARDHDEAFVIHGLIFQASSNVGAGARHLRQEESIRPRPTQATKLKVCVSYITFFHTGGWYS